MSHIIEVTPETEQRHFERRLSDISYRQKAERLDRLVVDLKDSFERWSIAYAAQKEGYGHTLPATTGYCEGNVHAISRILWSLDVKVDCPCESCTHARMSDAKKEGVTQ